MRLRRIPATIVAATVLVTGLTACSESGTSSSGTSAAASSENSDAITITHAFGETVIEGTPERVATVGWSNQETPLALGVVPVGMDKATFGDDDGDGILPWVKYKIDELGGETPVLFDTTDAIPYEEIAATEPDVILAANSGLTQEQYDELSKIAPTVAYPNAAWGTSLDEMVEMNSTALGQADEGEKLSSDLDKEVADAMAAHPDLEGKKVAFAFIEPTDMSKITIYTDHDTRQDFLLEAGFENPTVVTEESAKTDQFFVELSSENPGRFDDVDLFIAYGSDDDAENQKALEAMQADPLLSRIPAIKEGHVAFLGTGPLSAAASPAPLGIPWGIEKYLDRLNDAL
ncbi:iron-siderophore ABC transporter substrate-binding protein [Corynebacterium doosanense]|uniref:ABC transporter substrate-binding protein n=1 Tax=Corynebacterium doosanense CAU 212 = DSM 45436 TaxID=558173 RepID=A0A097ICR2_9CORY|nr:iron-siderophore ABC transporter substrate-binding protein [Corynebacterium doosanense]AIT59909.1 ABC transporter substrate-binding protein [Corynebacterium doosanense CAU 212 = DSM 45436]